MLAKKRVPGIEVTITGTKEDQDKIDQAKDDLEKAKDDPAAVAVFKESVLRKIIEAIDLPPGSESMFEVALEDVSDVVTLTPLPTPVTESARAHSCYANRQTQMCLYHFPIYST